MFVAGDEVLRLQERVVFLFAFELSHPYVDEDGEEDDVFTCL